jgi:hypothetical protein
MIPAIFTVIGAAVLLHWRLGRKRPPLGQRDLARLRLYSEKVQREDIQWFE